MQKVVEVLETEDYVLYFGNCYMKILQKAVLKPKNNLKSIKLESWKSEKNLHKLQLQILIEIFNFRSAFNPLQASQG